MDGPRDYHTKSDRERQILYTAAAKSLQSCLTLWDPKDFAKHKFVFYVCESVSVL